MQPVPIPYSLFPIPYSLLPIPYSLFPIPYSLFPIPYSLFPIPYSPNLRMFQNQRRPILDRNPLQGVLVPLTLKFFGHQGGEGNGTGLTAVDIHPQTRVGALQCGSFAGTTQK